MSILPVSGTRASHRSHLRQSELDFRCIYTIRRGDRTDLTSIVIGISVMATAVILGYWARAKTHAMFPLRDPVLLVMLLTEAVAIVALSGLELEGDAVIVTDLGAIMLLVSVAADAGFLMGHVMRRPGDVMYLDMPDDTLTMADVGPTVWYRHGGNLYVMPQTVGGIIASYLGARHPLDMPVWEISRQRSCTYTNGIRRPVTLDVVPVSLHETDTIVVGVFRFGSRKIRDENRNIVAESPRYLWHPEVVSHRVRFSRTVTEDPLAFWVKDELYRTSIQDAIDAEERAARLEIQMQSAKYDAGADLVAGLVSLSTDAPGSHEEILARIEAERKRRGEADAEHSR